MSVIDLPCINSGTHRRKGLTIQTVAILLEAGENGGSQQSSSSSLLRKQLPLAFSLPPIQSDLFERKRKGVEKK